MGSSSICWLKCNSGGASKWNPSLIGSSFCLRNHEGGFLGAKEVKITDSTILVVEPRAISEGLHFCLENPQSVIIIKTDSLAIVYIINGVWSFLKVRVLKLAEFK